MTGIRSLGEGDSRAHGQHESRNLLWLNWLLTILTVPVAIAVMLFAYGAALGVAGCPDDGCAHMGPGQFWFGVLAYGPPFVAAAAVVLAFASDDRPRAVWIPVVALTLLLADLAILAFTFRY